jgi:aspartate kinase
MALIVQKYGGTSVGNPERIKNVARRVLATQQAGNKVVAVVSAMSGVTDNLIKLAKEVHPEPNEREMDMLLSTGEQTTIALLAMALHSLGAKAVSLTGAQAGIVTDGLHTKAKIANITPKRVHEFLDNGNIVTIAGFQGETADGQITTLGRGGSDLTAIAIAAAVKADLCQIYTDVDGVYTSDPRIVPNARKLVEISYDEMLELAALGSKVMQARSVEFAKKFGVIFEVRSSFNDNPGTIVKEETAKMEDVVIRGVAVDKNQAKVTIAGVPDKPGIAAKVFKTIADAHINIDVIHRYLLHRRFQRGRQGHQSPAAHRQGNRRARSHRDGGNRQALRRRHRHALSPGRGRQNVRDARVHRRQYRHDLYQRDQDLRHHRVEGRRQSRPRRS